MAKKRRVKVGCNWWNDPLKTDLIKFGWQLFKDTDTGMTKVSLSARSVESEVIEALIYQTD